MGPQSEVVNVQEGLPCEGAERQPEQPNGSEGSTGEKTRKRNLEGGSQTRREVGQEILGELVHAITGTPERVDVAKRH
ncbi:MAG: hypothetical protein AAF098_17800 [Pseudomonadota bacterium]